MKTTVRTSVAVQWSSLRTSTAEGAGLIPGQGTKTLHAAWCGEKKKKNNTTMRYHLIPVRITIIKKTRNKCWCGCGEKGSFVHVGGNVNWCSHYGKQYGGASKNQKYNYHMIQQSHFWVNIRRMKSLSKETPASPCSLHYPLCIIYRHIFTAALFIFHPFIH